VKSRNGIDNQQNLQPDRVEAFRLQKLNALSDSQLFLYQKPLILVMRATRLQRRQGKPPFSFHQRDQGRNPEATTISPQQLIVKVSAKPPSARPGHDYSMNLLEARVEVFYDVLVTSGQKNL
jgi:hypothetical protein